VPSCFAKLTTFNVAVVSYAGATTDLDGPIPVGFGSTEGTLTIVKSEVVNDGRGSKSEGRSTKPTC
jgi:hypothetical protein